MTGKKYWNDIAGLLSFDLPYTWLYYKKNCIGIHPRYKDVVFDKRGAFINLEDWWIPVDERTKNDKIFQPLQ